MVAIEHRQVFWLTAHIETAHLPTLYAVALCWLSPITAAVLRRILTGFPFQFPGQPRKHPCVGRLSHRGNGVHAAIRERPLWASTLNAQRSTLGIPASRRRPGCPRLDQF